MNWYTLHLCSFYLPALLPVYGILLWRKTRQVSWRLAQLFHQRLVNRIGIYRKDISKGAIGRIADCCLFILQRSLGLRSPEGFTQLCSNRTPVISRPRVVHAGVDHCQCPRRHRSTKIGVANPLKRRNSSGKGGCARCSQRHRCYSVIPE